MIDMSTEAIQTKIASLRRLTRIFGDVDALLRHAKPASIDRLARIERMTNAQQALVADLLDIRQIGAMKRRAGATLGARSPRGLELLAVRGEAGRQNRILHAFHRNQAKCQRFCT